MALRLPVRRHRMIAAALALAVVASGAFAVSALASDEPSYAIEDRMLSVPGGPGEPRRIALDTRIYRPDGAAERPVPAVLLGHGFGGDKHAVADDAIDLARRGYLVVTWSARGFGRSGGQIHLNSPDHEIADARRLVDVVAKRRDVARNERGDPKVGAVGGSYGGALALGLAARDRRVDAIVPQVTWNDLGRALFPEASGGGTERGVFKKAWADVLFSAGVRGERGPITSDPACGRFARDVCELYQRTGISGRADRETTRLLERASPGETLGDIEAPTLLVQGTADTLFPVSEAEANARAIAKAGTPVRVEWFSGGHNDRGSVRDRDRVRDLTAAWLDHYLRGMGPEPQRSFGFSRVTGYDYEADAVRTVEFEAARYHFDPEVRTHDLRGRPGRIANPPGGSPAAISSLPGLQIPAYGPRPEGTLPVGVEQPGQFVAYESKPLRNDSDVVGGTSVRVKAASPTGEAVLFVKVYDVSERAGAQLLGGQVAPIRLSGLPKSYADAEPVEVELPGVVHRFAPGHRIRVVIASADQAYKGPASAAVYTVGLEGPEVVLPDVTAEAEPSPAGPWLWAVTGVAGLILVGTVVVWLVARRRSSSRDRTVVEEYADIPLVVQGLGKSYPDLTALRDVSFEVHRGQVVGLLGPNGAGKTTTLRVLLGLIAPDTGTAWVFGHRVTPGAPVLGRLGALVEGPGLLPHLSGRANLELFWRSTGRPDSESGLEEVLEVADLGTAIDRKVRTYSHGMKQRLAIAQAMLGLPELLVLDEPTDGLDPPQIAEMRRVLRRYAENGRAVLVSSHLLAEVEQTCSHVVVLSRGSLLAAGPVSDVAGESRTVVVQASSLARAEALLADVEGIGSVVRQNGSLLVELDGASRSALVRTLVSAGIEIDSVVPRRRLEDAFLTLVGESGR